MPGHSEKLLGCDVVIAEKTIEAVTGIRSGYNQGREIRVAEFNERFDLTDAVTCSPIFLQS